MQTQKGWFPNSEKFIHGSRSERVCSMTEWVGRGMHTNNPPKTILKRKGTSTLPEAPARQPKEKDSQNHPPGGGGEGQRRGTKKR